MLYPDFPLTQQVKLMSKWSRIECIREIAENTNYTELITLEISQDELFMMARNEESLTKPIKTLQDTLGDNFQTLPPQIRYMRVGNTLYEPNMHLRVSINTSYLNPVRNDLLSRKFKILEECKTIGGYVFRAEMPLRLILGYKKILEDLSESNGLYLSWLHSYTPYKDVTI